MTRDDPLARLPGAVRKLVEEKAGGLGLTPAELAARLWEKERLIPPKHGGTLERLYAALYGVFIELQPEVARDAFAFGPRKKGEARPRIKEWAVELFQPSVVETSFVVLVDGRIVEEVLTGAGPAFVVYTPNPEAWEIVREVESEGTTYRPVPVDEKLANALTLPDGVEEYGSVAELLDSMVALADEVYDAGSATERPVWTLWILNAFSSWVAKDLFNRLPERFLPILAVVGPSGAGKKRALSVMRAFAYRALYFLKTTRAPSLYRSIDPWGAVFLILDEADLYDSGESADFVQFLNSRADGATIPRYSPERDRNQNFLSFGYTALALRKAYGDTGIASRSITLGAEATTRDVDLILTPEWAERARVLRRRLLLWRLRTLVRIRRGEVRVPSRLQLEGVKAHRVREALLIVAAQAGEDPRVMETITSVGEDLQRRLIRQNSDSIEGMILGVVYGWLEDGGVAVPDGTGWHLERTRKEGDEERQVPLTVKTIVDSLGQAITYAECARWVRGLQLGINPRKEIGGRRYKGILRVLDPERLGRQFERFVVDAEPMADDFSFPAGGSRQTRLAEGGEGTGRNLYAERHARAGHSGQSGHPPIDGGPTGRTGPPTSPSPGEKEQEGEL